MSLVFKKSWMEPQEHFHVAQVVAHDPSSITLRLHSMHPSQSEALQSVARRTEATGTPYRALSCHGEGCHPGVASKALSKSGTRPQTFLHCTVHPCGHISDVHETRERGSYIQRADHKCPDCLHADTAHHGGLAPKQHQITRRSEETPYTQGFAPEPFGGAGLFKAFGDEQENEGSSGVASPIHHVASFVKQHGLRSDSIHTAHTDAHAKGIEHNIIHHAMGPSIAGAHHTAMNLNKSLEYNPSSPGAAQVIPALHAAHVAIHKTGLNIEHHSLHDAHPNVADGLHSFLHSVAHGNGAEHQALHEHMGGMVAEEHHVQMIENNKRGYDQLQLGKSLIFKRKGSSLDTRRDQLGFVHDNPVVAHGDAASHEWLNAHPRSVTGWYHGVNVHTHHVRNLPGARGEHDNLDRRKVHEMAADMRDHGYHHGHINVAVDHHGHAAVTDGNHRLRAASTSGMSHVPLNVSYEGGSEMLRGVFDPANMPTTMPPAVHSEKQRHKILSLMHDRR